MYVWSVCASNNWWKCAPLWIPCGTIFKIQSYSFIYTKAYRAAVAIFICPAKDPHLKAFVLVPEMLHFLLPDLRMRPNVEEKCSADLSHSDRKACVSFSVPSLTSAEDAELELLPSSDTSSLVRALCRWGDDWFWFSFPSPSKWAWNVVVCCSKDRKLSCTLSNCSMLDWSNSSGQTDSLLQLTLLLMWAWLHVNSCSIWVVSFRWAWQPWSWFL